MDHATVVRHKMTEQYLLNELDAHVRDEFEEHYFACSDCAADVSAATELVEHSKLVFSEEQARESVPRRTLDAPNPGPAESPARGWLAWLRPAFLVPAMALLLVVVGYQNFVVLPSLRQPHVLPWASINVGTWGGGEGGATTVTAPPGEGFLLFVRIPPDAAYSRYIADLHNPAGKLEWSLPIQAASSAAGSQQDQWPVQIPPADRTAGVYTLAVRGVTPAGESKQVGQASFELQIQK